MENIVNNINTEVTSTNPERLHTVLIVSFETTKKRYYFEVLGNNVKAIIYSFQNAKKLNKITVIILGFAMGIITLTIVL